MRREIDINEISDGRRYRANDMVKADCMGCKGCHDCCTGMGDSIKLDPYDADLLAKGLGIPFGSLIGRRVELNPMDGIVIPNLMMTKDKEACGFLDEEGRCTVHEVRPGFCRLFPLGRIYENDGFSYFLQIYECDKPHAKIKVSKWVDIPDFASYEHFVLQWHRLLKQTEALFTELAEQKRTDLNMFMLKLFYLTPYGDDFYAEFAKRYDIYQEEMKRITE